MKLYTGDDGVDMDDLEQALTIVKRKTAVVPELPHLKLEKVEGDATMAGVDDAIAAPALRASAAALRRKPDAAGRV